jgi:hypothetical protein
VGTLCAECRFYRTATASCRYSTRGCTGTIRGSNGARGAKSLHIGLDTMDYQQLASTILHQISTLPTEDIPTTVEASTTTGNGVVPSQDGRWSVVSWPFYGDNANHSKRHFGLVSNKEGYHIALGDTDEAMARQHCEYLNGSV